MQKISNQKGYESDEFPPKIVSCEAESRLDASTSVSSCSCNLGAGTHVAGYCHLDHDSTQPHHVPKKTCRFDIDDDAKDLMGCWRVFMIFLAFEQPRCFQARSCWRWCCIWTTFATCSAGLMSHELPNLRWCIHFTSLTCRLVVRETAYKSLASIAYQCPLPKSSKLEGWSMSQSSSNNPKVSGVEVDRGPSKSGTTLRGVRRSRFSLCALIASIASSAGCDVRHKSAQNQIGSSTGKLVANIYMYVGLLKFWYMKYRLNHITRLHLIWQIPIYVYI